MRVFFFVIASKAPVPAVQRTGTAICLSSIVRHCEPLLQIHHGSWKHGKGARQSACVPNQESASCLRDDGLWRQTRYNHNTDTSQSAIITSTIPARISVDQPQPNATSLVAFQASFCFLPSR